MRPLCDDESDSPQAITRDYTLDIHDENGKAPLLSVFGGKLTTYRKLAEHALEKLTPYYQALVRRGRKRACCRVVPLKATVTITPPACAAVTHS